MRFKFLSIALLASASLLPLSALAMVDQATLAELNRTFESGRLPAMSKAAEQLVYFGIDDDTLYQKVATAIETNLETATTKSDIDAVAWLCKGLAASGDDKYQAVLTKVAASSNKKLKKYGGQALASLDQYKVWNPLIRDHSSDNLAFEKGVYQVYYNMISTSDPELMRIGAKRVEFERIGDPLLLNKLRDRLLEEAMKDGDDSDWEDAVSWMARALAVSGGEPYFDDLRKVAAEAKNKKIGRYAVKYIK